MASRYSWFFEFAIFIARSIATDVTWNLKRIHLRKTAFTAETHEMITPIARTALMTPAVTLSTSILNPRAFLQPGANAKGLMMEESGPSTVRSSLSERCLPVTGRTTGHAAWRQHSGNRHSRIAMTASRKPVGLLLLCRRFSFADSRRAFQAHAEPPSQNDVTQQGNAAKHGYAQKCGNGDGGIKLVCINPCRFSLDHRSES